MGKVWDLISEDELAKIVLETDLMKLISRMLCDDNEEDIHSGLTTCSCCGQHCAAESIVITKHPQLKTIYVACPECMDKLSRETEPDKALDHMLLERMWEKFNKGTLGEVADEES